MVLTEKTDNNNNKRKVTFISHFFFTSVAKKIVKTNMTIFRLPSWDSLMLQKGELV